MAARKFGEPCGALRTVTCCQCSEAVLTPSMTADRAISRRSSKSGCEGGMEDAGLIHASRAAVEVMATTRPVNVLTRRWEVPIGVL